VTKSFLVDQHGLLRIIQQCRWFDCCTLTKKEKW